MTTTVKKWMLVSLLILAAPPAYAAPLYFPHVDTSLPWQTEIAVINTGDQTVTGTLRGLSDAGTLVETKAITLAARGRRQIVVADEFTNHLNIGYLVFDTESATVQGYTKFYQAGVYRAAIPAVKEVNASDIYVSHIDSSADWWTGVSLVNTTAAVKNLAINFSNGTSLPYTLNPNEHRVFTIRSLFNNQPQPGIGSAVITNAAGVIGLELFGNIGGSDHLEGILLTDRTASTLYYPHVASDPWWTGIVAYNPSAFDSTITIQPFSAQGTALAPVAGTVAAGGKYVGVVSQLGLSPETAWFRIDATRALTGFELFCTVNGNQLAAYAGGGGAGSTAGVFPKIEKSGWTGIALVNREATPAFVTLTAYTDNGTAVATRVLTVAGNAKVVNLPEDIFAPLDIDSATYIAYSSDRNIVGFQINGSSDGTLLDALPGLSGTAAGTIVTAADYTIAAGEEVSVTGNLIIIATGSVRISGALRATGDLGQNITIIAGGDVTISGSVAAGNGAAGGGAGGWITITSNGGNIVLGSTGSLRAGNGANGQATSNAAGGAGGSVSLNAPNGSITIPDAAGVIVLGNGGSGATITTTAAAETAGRMQRDTGGAGNRGGDSGRPSFTAQTLIGIEYDTITVTENFPTDNPIHRVGDVIKVIRTAKPFSGGSGGNGGSVQANASANSATGDGTRAVVMADEAAEATGGKGGNGWDRGGEGGNAEATGKPGSEAATDGQRAYARGGDGGSCAGSSSFDYKDCAPGKGGNATARGSNGAKGSDPSGPGGSGGASLARGGDGGSKFSSQGTFDFEGIGGDATASAGNGGNGGNGCGPVYAAFGGNGGGSNNATAVGGWGIPKGLAVAVGGSGGNGGNGQVGGGTGGYSGFAQASNCREGSTQTNGTNGSNGTTCPPIPTLARIPGTYTLTGMKKSDTCGGWPAEIYNPAVDITVSGNEVTIHSTAKIKGLYDEATGAFSGTGQMNYSTEMFAGNFGFLNSQVELLGALFFGQLLPTACEVRYDPAKYTKNP